MIDHETAARFRLPNRATLDVWHVLVTDCWYWAAHAAAQGQSAAQISEAVYRAARRGAPALEGIDLPAVDWPALRRALLRWYERDGWRVTGGL